MYTEKSVRVNPPSNMATPSASSLHHSINGAPPSPPVASTTMLSPVVAAAAAAAATASLSPTPPHKPLFTASSVPVHRPTAAATASRATGGSSTSGAGGTFGVGGSGTSLLFPMPPSRVQEGIITEEQLRAASALMVSAQQQQQQGQRQSQQQQQQPISFIPAFNSLNAFNALSGTNIAAAAAAAAASSPSSAASPGVAATTSHSPSTPHEAATTTTAPPTENSVLRLLANATRIPTPSSLGSAPSPPAAAGSVQTPPSSFGATKTSSVTVLGGAKLPANALVPFPASATPSPPSTATSLFPPAPGTASVVVAGSPPAGVRFMKGIPVAGTAAASSSPLSAASVPAVGGTMATATGTGGGRTAPSVMLPGKQPPPPRLPLPASAAQPGSSFLQLSSSGPGSTLSGGGGTPLTATAAFSSRQTQPVPSSALPVRHHDVVIPAPASAAAAAAAAAFGSVKPTSTPAAAFAPSPFSATPGGSLFSGAGMGTVNSPTPPGSAAAAPPSLSAQPASTSRRQEEVKVLDILAQALHHPQPAPATPPLPLPSSQQQQQMRGAAAFPPPPLPPTPPKASSAAGLSMGVAASTAVDSVASHHGSTPPVMPAPPLTATSFTPTASQRREPPSQHGAVPIPLPHSMRDAMHSSPHSSGSGGPPPPPAPRSAQQQQQLTSLPTPTRHLSPPVSSPSGAPPSAPHQSPHTVSSTAIPAPRSQLQQQQQPPSTSHGGVQPSSAAPPHHAPHHQQQQPSLRPSFDSQPPPPPPVTSFPPPPRGARGLPPPGSNSSDALPSHLLSHQPQQHTPASHGGGRDAGSGSVPPAYGSQPPPSIGRPPHHAPPPPPPPPPSQQQQPTWSELLGGGGGGGASRNAASHHHNTPSAVGSNGNNGNHNGANADYPSHRGPGRGGAGAGGGLGARMNADRGADRGMDRGIDRAPPHYAAPPLPPPPPPPPPSQQQQPPPSQQQQRRRSPFQQRQPNRRGGGGAGERRLPSTTSSHDVLDADEMKKLIEDALDDIDVRNQGGKGQPRRRQPDPEMVSRFKRDYGSQDDDEAIADHLRVQARTALGTVGTLDVDECLRIMEVNDVTFVVTDTGTGKSTLIPKELLIRYPNSVIVNAQPRRTSTINLAQRVAKMLEETPGTTVGYSVRGEHVGELGETRLMYVTNYTLFLYFLWRKPEDIPFTHIIMDEFHERTPEVEMMLLLLKLVLQRFPKKFKLVLCSATAQVEEWTSFFDGFTIGEYCQANPMYPIHEYYLQDLCQLLGMHYSPVEVSQDNTVTSLQLQNTLLLIRELLTFLAGLAAPQHSILVFLPGRTMVEQMTNWIRKHLNDQLDPIAWYRDIDLAFIQAALQREAVTKKKVYLATDIAEVSLTLPDVVFVIDSGTAKRPQVSERKPSSVAFPPLQLLWESAMNSQQRRGRVGRVQQGFYLCLLSREHQQRLPDGDSRIANTVLHELVLHTLHLTSTPFAAFGLCREEPRAVSVQLSLMTLRDGGYILPKDDPLAKAEEVTVVEDAGTTELLAAEGWNEIIMNSVSEKDKNKPKSPDGPDLALLSVQGIGVLPADPAILNSSLAVDDRRRMTRQSYQVTMKGIIVSHTPVSIEAGTMVFHGLVLGVPTLCMLMAAVEATKSPFYVPYDITDRMEKSQSCERVTAVMRKFKGELKCDLVSAVAAVLDYMEMQRDGFSDEAQEQWCEERHLSRPRIVDSLHLFSQIKEQVAAVVPFPDVTDLDALRAQFDKQAQLLVLVTVAAHMQWAVYVQNDQKTAQRLGYVGSGVFFSLQCLQAMFVPTVCPWQQSTICVPLSLQTTYERLLGTFATQVDPIIFNLTVLMFSYRLRFEAQEDKYFFHVRYLNVPCTFMCDILTARQILQLRRMQCAQLSVLQQLVEHRVEATNFEAMADHLRSLNTDFGIPENFQSRPELLPALLLNAISSLIQRFQSRTPDDTTTFCQPTSIALPLASSAESLLIQSSNGIILSGGAPTHSPTPPPPLAEQIIEEGDEDDDSDNESGDHVPIFHFDV